VREIQNKQSDSSFLVSFDVSSLFTSISLNETIEIALDYLYVKEHIVHGLSRSQFKKLLAIDTSETNLIFNGHLSCYHNYLSRFIITIIIIIILLLFQYEKILYNTIHQ